MTDALFEAEDYRTPGLPRSLAERFVVPPLSILDQSQGYWRERKREWLSLGIESGLGRAATFHGTSVSDRLGWDQSIFDPVLAEIVYRWWSPPDALILDPFAGGSVRGVVAGALGRRYVGMDLSAEQVKENQRQALKLADVLAVSPRWVVGDSLTTLPIEAATQMVDLVFTCPPYGDLERYTNDPRDLSVMPIGRFEETYRAIVSRSVRRLSDDRFAVFVVGNYRDRRNGRLQDMVGWTIRAATDGGAAFYADVILATPIQAPAMRAPSKFAAGRKPMRRHQYVLVFVKGDWRRAAAGLEGFIA